ncbi:Gene product J, partial [Varanus komodoensis]
KKVTSRKRKRSPIYSLGGDFRFSAFISKLLVVDFSSSVLLVSIISPSSVEMTCCCFRGFFLGEAPGGKSLGGTERLLASNVSDGETVFVVRGGTAEKESWGPSTVERTPLMVDGGGGAVTIVAVAGGGTGTVPGMVDRAAVGCK